MCFNQRQIIWILYCSNQASETDRYQFVDLTAIVSNPQLDTLSTE